MNDKKEAPPDYVVSDAVASRVKLKDNFNPNRSLENFASFLSQNRANVTYYVSIQIL